MPSPPAPPVLKCFFDTGYSNLTNVAYYNGVSEIFLQPLNGRTVVLNSLDLGAWSLPKEGGLTIVDGLGNVLFSTGSITIGSKHFTFDNISSTTGIGILVQNSFLVGIDNIQFIVHAPRSHRRRWPSRHDLGER
jgi:hypothetical protein